MTSRRLIILQAILTLLTLVLLVFFVQTRSVNIDQHNKRLDLLFKVQQIEGVLDRDVLRVTSYMLLQFDPLVDVVKQLYGLKQQIYSPEVQIEGEEGERYRAHLDAYMASIDEKLALVEHIKSKVALARNGLQYLPMLARELSGKDHEAGDQVRDLISELYHFYQFSAVSEAGRLERMIGALSQQRFDHPELQSMVENALFHVRTNLRLSKELGALRASYVAVPSKQRFDALYREYESYYSRQSVQSEMFSLLLLVLVLGLFVGLSIAIYQLSKSRTQVGKAHGQLQAALESLDEAFALFAPDGRLVLYNRKYTELYPWLGEVLERGDATLDEIVQLNSAQAVEDNTLPDDEAHQLPCPELPCSEKQSYIEQWRNGRWYLASDSCTEDGEIVCVRVDISESKRAEQELRKLYRAIDQSPSAVVITDRQGQIEYVNPKFEEVTGYLAEDVLGKNPSIMKPDDASPEMYEDLWSTILSGKTWRGQFRNTRKNGGEFWESATISPVRDSKGHISHFIAVKEDITAQKTAQEQLRMNATVFETTMEGIMITDAENRIKSVNPAFSQITGYQPEEVIGQNPRILRSDNHDESYYRGMWSSLYSKGYWSGEIWNRRKDGTVFPEWLSLAVIRDEQGNVKEHVAVFSDITRRKEDEEQIRRQANYDPLTGLPNRNLLVDRLNQSILAANREKTQVALLFIDLDGFKRVNDTLGHVVGDDLLRQVAERFNHAVRESDTVARFGGDEFVIVLPDVHKIDDVGEVAQKIIDEINLPFKLVGREIFVGASIGITLYPDDATDSGVMLRNADMAMYLAKESGRNCYRFFTPAMDDEVKQHMELERELRLALDHRELVLKYQAVVDLETGRLNGVEALVYWNHPQRGLVSPDVFISLAEETGLISSIGSWVLTTAARQAKVWHDQGLNLRVNVNLSSKQLALGLTTEDVRAILEETGVDPSTMTLEITEGMMLEGGEATLQWLGELKAMGLGLAIDDFGTGYSSLSYLKLYPMDILKIDRSFISGIPHNQGDSTLVEAIVSMARSLGLKIVAEGIENGEQLGFLQRLGCELGQGYLFNKPTWGEAIAKMAANPLRLSELVSESTPPSSANSSHRE
ncbi:MAG: EAL domain-containing protein [Sedimenticola sp.]